MRSSSNAPAKGGFAPSMTSSKTSVAIFRNHMAALNAYLELEEAKGRSRLLCKAQRSLRSCSRDSATDSPPIMADRPLQALVCPDRPVQQCQDIFVRQLGCAIEELNEHEPNVHGARKLLKRARATLRLLRAVIGDELYRRENVVARDAARPLSNARDDEVMNGVLKGLAERFGTTISGENVRTAAHADSVNKLTSIKTALERAMTRAQARRPDADGWDSDRDRAALHLSSSAPRTAPRAQGSRDRRSARVAQADQVPVASAAGSSRRSRRARSVSWLTSSITSPTTSAMSTTLRCYVRTTPT